ncbi:hypothetical protein BDV93DRAFT_189636 [Ceratobasidium sp. AG-I]|nr:hypothetical protein BDV93DRAFT_189636 [Ceratobasidium sp. AG-I]
MLAKCFPSHLYPGDTGAKCGLELHPLPFGVNLRQIYSDFLCYLLRYTRAYFEDHMLDGKQLWVKLKPTIEVVITCPHEWGIQEQEFLRGALATTGLMGEAASGQARFVTESKAIAYFLCRQTVVSSLFQPAKNFVICSAGDSVVKMTMLSIIATQPVLKLKEHFLAYIQTGGILVDVAAECYIRNALSNAGLSDEDIFEYTMQGVKHFGNFTKRSFHDPTANCMIEIAGTRFNNPSIKTRRGRMEISGATIQSFFDAPIREINAALDKLFQTSTVMDIILTGDFGGNPFLQKMLKERYEPKGYKISPTNDFACNVVADGAVIWGAADHSHGRVLRCSYGLILSTMFNPEAKEHLGRETYICSGGYEKVIGAWSQLVNKGDTIDQDEVIRVPFNRMFTSSSESLNTFQADLFAYMEEGKPSFARDQQGKLLDGFRRICTMTADLASLRGGLQEIVAPGKSYWNLTYDLCLRFGGIELGSNIEWQEKGATRIISVKIKPVEVVYLD